MFDRMHEDISARLEKASIDACDEWGSTHPHYRDTDPLKGMCFHHESGPNQDNGPSVGIEKKEVSIDKQERSDDSQKDRRGEISRAGCTVLASGMGILTTILWKNQLRSLGIHVPFDPFFYDPILLIFGGFAVKGIIDIFLLVKKDKD